jgi:hypothetical protein
MVAFIRPLFSFSLVGLSAERTTFGQTGTTTSGLA